MSQEPLRDILRRADGESLKPRPIDKALVDQAENVASMYEARALSVVSSAEKLAAHLNSIAADLRRQTQQNAEVLARHNESMERAKNNLNNLAREPKDD